MSITPAEQIRNNEVFLPTLSETISATNTMNSLTRYGEYAIRLRDQDSKSLWRVAILTVTTKGYTTGEIDWNKRYKITPVRSHAIIRLANEITDKIWTGEPIHTQQTQGAKKAMVCESKGIFGNEVKSASVGLNSYTLAREGVAITQWLGDRFMWHIRVIPINNNIFSLTLNDNEYETRELLHLKHEWNTLED